MFVKYKKNFFSPHCFKEDVYRGGVKITHYTISIIKSFMRHCSSPLSRSTQTVWVILVKYYCSTWRLQVKGAAVTGLSPRTHAAVNTNPSSDFFVHRYSNSALANRSAAATLVTWPCDIFIIDAGSFLVRSPFGFCCQLRCCIYSRK